LQIASLSGKLRGEKLNEFSTQKFKCLISLSFAAVDIAVLLLPPNAFAYDLPYFTFFTLLFFFAL